MKPSVAWLARSDWIEIEIETETSLLCNEIVKSFSTALPRPLPLDEVW